jgi:hypothetical protein
MAMIENETLTRKGACREHGDVQAVREIPKLKFPFVITGVARGLAARRPYRCPECGAKVSSEGARG